jgi:hypothetical protein
MGKLYWVFIVGFCALLGYAGATGNFGILPKIEFPFGQSENPPSDVLTTFMLLPDRSGTAGFTVGQMAAHLQKSGAKLSWEQGAAQQSWIMRYTMRNELTNADFSGAARLTLLPDASVAGMHGRAIVATAWAEEGRDLTLPQIYVTVLNIASSIKENGV